MRRRDFLAAVGAGAVMGLGAATQVPALETARPKRPNVLFLFTDDQRFDAVHALGNPEIVTPNMDKLVQSGVAFTHAFIMGSLSGAVCMPSRAMLMSGRNLFHLRGQGEDIPPEHATLPETFKNAGYTTFASGKWHNGPQSFARSFSCGDAIFFGGMANHLEVPVFDYDPTGRYANEASHIGRKFSSELFSDAAIEFLRGLDDDAPFFAYVAYTAPHDPRMAPKEYADLYPPDKITLPKNFMPEHPFDNGELRIRDENLAPFPRTPEAIREHIAAYYAMITHLDAQIGRVLQALDETGKRDNTIIVFAGDNGLALGQHGLMGKQNLYEHSVRVPLVMTGPGIAQGVRCDAVCYLHDVFPTLCDLAGTPIPASVQTQSLAPLIRGQNKGRDSVFAVYRYAQRMVRDGQWKLIKYNVNGEQTTQLFDERGDPWELTNLAGDPAHSQRLSALTAKLEQWMRNVDDPCAMDKPGWGLAGGGQS